MLTITRFHRPAAKPVGSDAADEELAELARDERRTTAGGARDPQEDRKGTETAHRVLGGADRREPRWRRTSLAWRHRRRPECEREFYEYRVDSRRDAAAPCSRPLVAHVRDSPVWTFVATTTVYGDFEWDFAKATTNLRKHGVSFEEATTIFADPCYLLQADDAVPDRFLALGMSGMLRILVVVHVERGPRLRVISARRATRSEAKTYEARRF